ncbi:hypothetical protein, partial [Nocardia farcinica]
RPVDPDRIRSNHEPGSPAGCLTTVTSSCSSPYQRGLLVPRTRHAHLQKLLAARKTEIESLVRKLTRSDAPITTAKVIQLRPGAASAPELPFPS